MAWQDMVVPVDPAPAQPAVNLGGGVTSPATAQPAATPVATVTVRPVQAKLAPEVLTKKAVDLGYAPGGAAGITQNILRESGGDPTQVGDSGTSAGLFQHHNERRTALEAYAKAQGKSADDPDVQFQFADQEMRTQYPKLRAKLMDPTTTPAEAEGLFRTIFERPKVGSGPGGAAAIEAPNFKFSDYALKQYANKPDTDVVWMKPSDYLDLTPDLGSDVKGQKAAKELAASLAKGEPIEAIPTLDVQTGPNGAKVVDQDGRHRALAAQEAGLDLIPVAVKRERNASDEAGLASVGAGGMPQKPITELEGMTGKLLPFDFQPYQAPGKAAEAAPTDADGMLLSGVKGAAAGFGRTVLGAQELVGQGLSAVGATGPGDWLTQDAQKGVANLQTEMAPDQAAHPIASEVGSLLGSSVLPGGAAAKIGGNALRMGAAAGAASGLFEPTTPGEGSFAGQKAEQVGVGTLAGLATSAAGGVLSKAIAPTFRKAVQTLMGEGVQLTPGQMAGGAAKAAEDRLASIPVAGDMIRGAQRRSIETFNRAAINRALEPIGQTLPAATPMGHEAVAATARILGAAYDQVIPKMVGQLDAPLQADIANITRLGANFPPEQAGELNKIIQHEVLDRFSPGGGISGQTAQEIGTNLRPVIEKLQQSTKTDERRLAGAVKELRASLVRMMERTNPALTAQKKKIDQGWANYKIIENAAQMLGAKDGIFTPAQLSNAVRASDATLDNRAFAQGVARMQDLSDAAKDVLPQVVPDSGTAGRLIMAGMLGEGAHMLSPGILAGGAAIAAPYTAVAGRLTNMLMSRLAQVPGPTRNALSQGARNLSPMLAPTAAQSVPGQ